MGPIDRATRRRFTAWASHGARACGVVLALSSVGCMPTISEQRGKEHWAAFEEAEAHQHSGRFAEAVVAYQRAAETAERRVDRDEMLYRASRVYARMKDFPNAIRICDELGNAQPVARRTLRARLDAARYRIETGEREAGETALRTLIVEEQESAAARSALRILSERYVDGAESKDDAIQWLDALIEETGDSSITEPLMGMKAEMLLLKGDKDEAFSVLEAQIAKFPYPQGARWDDALNRMADISLERGDPKAAVGYLERMISVHESSFILGSYTRPLFSKSALRIGRIYRDELHDNKAAIAAFAHMRSEFPHSPHRDDSLLEEAMIRLDTGDSDGACELLGELLEDFNSGTARRKGEALQSERCGSGSSSKR
jgi:tetratricopeptide (TPR) repeat protein